MRTRGILTQEDVGDGRKAPPSPNFEVSSVPPHIHMALPVQIAVWPYLADGDVAEGPIKSPPQ